MADMIVRPWTVTVSGYGHGDYIAASRGKALADAWRSSAFEGWTFGEFLKRARCTLMAVDAEADRDDANVIASAITFRAGGIDRDHDAAQVGVLGDAQGIDPRHIAPVLGFARFERPQRPVDLAGPLPRFEPQPLRR